MMPFAMEYVNGIMMIARNPPTTPAISSKKSIFVTELIMSRPTNKRAGVTANVGIAVKIGLYAFRLRDDAKIGSISTLLQAAGLRNGRALVQ